MRPAARASPDRGDQRVEQVHLPILEVRFAAERFLAG
jgi:hypothetical protein